MYKIYISYQLSTFFPSTINEATTVDSDCLLPMSGMVNSALQIKHDISAGLYPNVHPPTLPLRHATPISA